MVPSICEDTGVTYCLVGDMMLLMNWPDALNQVHMEADRKATLSEASMPTDPHFQAKVTYRIGNKVTTCSLVIHIWLQFLMKILGWRLWRTQLASVPLIMDLVYIKMSFQTQTVHYRSGHKQNFKYRILGKYRIAKIHIGADSGEISGIHII